MKKQVIFVIIFLMLFANVSAITSNLKEKYEKKETAIVELSGSILNTLSKNNIKILRGGHINSGVEYDIKKLNNKYYLWFISPQNEGNYTLSIKNILTNEGGTQKFVNYEKKFIVGKNTTDYSINPGAIFASSDFSVNIALYSENELIIDINLPYSRSILLQQGNNKIDFLKSDFQGTKFMIINMGKYGVPSYVVGVPVVNNTINNSANNSINNSINVTNLTSLNQTGNKTEMFNQTNSTFNDTIFNDTINQTNNNFNGSFRVLPKNIKTTILIGEKTDEFPFRVINLKNETLNNISLEYDKGIFKISPENISSINANESVIFNIELKTNLTRGIRKPIIVYSGKEFQYLIFELNFTNKEEEVETTYNTGESILNQNRNSLLYCVGEIPDGKICSSVSGEVCDKRTIMSKEGDCCTGKCVKKEGESKSWIGYVIIGVAILALLFIYLKYKKTKPLANPMAGIGKSLDASHGLPPKILPGTNPLIKRNGL